MPINDVRTRFAPSPTGYMHVGNLRTALYAYLIAKKSAGKFILRIEDTDQERLVSGAVDMIYNTLRNASLIWDEGPDIGGKFGPYIQSQRSHIYLGYALDLIEKGHAYYCFCDKERLDEVKTIQSASGISPMYDRHCRDLSPKQVEANLKAKMPFVIRQKMPLDGQTSFNDVVFGTITVENQILDDNVLIKADKMPTYNFANVIDDHTMGITHVVRGNEYLSSTPKYNLLYKSFGWDEPIYIHCSPVMKNATEKLSKRNGDATFEDLLDKGFLPDAILNYIALLGWAPKGEREIFNLEELVEEFAISGISKSPAIFDIAKLKAINGSYIRNLDFETFRNMAEKHIKKTCKNGNVDLIAKLIHTRTEIFSDIPEQVDFIDSLPEYPTSLYIHKKMKTDEQNSLEALKNILSILENVDIWEVDSIHDVLFKLISELGVKNGQILWPLRVATSGKPFTPGGGIDICEILGKPESISRIKLGIKKLSNL